MRPTLVLSGLLFTLSVSASAPIIARLPPPFNLPPPPSACPFVPIPTGWDFGKWYVTHSTTNNSLYRNIQYSPTPISPLQPAGPRNDLSSLQTLHNDTVFYTYGVDTPVVGLQNVYEFNSTGILEGADDLLSILAWGYDDRGVEWYVSHSTFTSLLNIPPSIDVLSRHDDGPTKETLEKIKCALNELGNDVIDALVEALAAIKQDGARRWEAPYVCDDYCKSNEDLLALLG